MVGQRDITRAVPPRRAFWKSKEGAAALDLDPVVGHEPLDEFLILSEFHLLHLSHELGGRGKMLQELKEVTGGKRRCLARC